MRIIFIAFLLASFLLFAGCVEQTQGDGNAAQADESQQADLQQAEIMPILMENGDFADWSKDFVETQGFEPQLQLTKKERLSAERVSEMIEESPVGMKDITRHILSDFPLETGNVFYVEMVDKAVQHKGIIAIIDAEEKKAIRFFATLGIAV